jgi:hypothetical protein
VLTVRHILISAILAFSGAAIGFAQQGKPAVAVIPGSLAHSVLPAATPLQSPPSVPLGVIKTAMTYLGVPYVHGGDSRTGLDCSGLVFRVFNDILKVELPRGVDGLFRTGMAEHSPLHLGDLVFFDTTEGSKISVPTHVGVYVGSNRFVHAASEGTKTGVIVSTLQSSYYKDRFLGARRVIEWRAPVLPVILTDDDKKIVQTNPFPSHESLTVQIFNNMTGGGPMDLSILKDGKEVLAKRIVPGAQKPAEVTLVPDEGQWTVKVSRIYKGRELQSLAFTVVE